MMSYGLSVVAACVVVAAALVGARSAGVLTTATDASAVLAGRPIENGFFRVGVGRELIQRSFSQPVAVYLFEWSECLYCVAQADEWKSLAKSAPSVHASLILTKRLPPDVNTFLKENDFETAVLVDSASSLSSLSATLPLRLLFVDGKVEVAVVGKDLNTNFWADVRSRIDGRTPMSRRSSAEASAQIASCSASGSAVPKELPFSDFGTVTSRRLVSDSLLRDLLGVSALDISRQGDILVTDGRGRRVAVARARSVSLQGIGREGEGPGEFRSPRWATFGFDGSIAVLDISLARIGLFDSTGRFSRFVRSPTVDARAISLLQNGDLLVAGDHSLGERHRVLSRIRSDGTIVWTAVPTDTIFFALDKIVSGAWLTRPDGDEVAVGLAVSSAFSVVNVKDGSVRCRGRIPPQAWVQLSPAARPTNAGLVAVRSWIERATTIVGATRIPRGELVVTTLSGAEGSEVMEWIVFDSSFSKVFRVKGPPGIAVASSQGSLVVSAEDDEGKISLREVRLHRAR